LERDAVSSAAELQTMIAPFERARTEHRDVHGMESNADERFRNMADEAPVLIWMTGQDTLCTFFNKAWLAFTGRTLEQELGGGWTEGVHPDDLGRCLATYTSAFQARRKFQMEYRLRRADSAYRWVLDKGVPCFEPDGAFIGYLGSCVDITDVKRTQEENFDRQRLESLRLLTGGIAHDFNNLMSTILIIAELAEAEMEDGRPPGDEVRRIKSVAGQAVEMVRELMIYAGEDKGTFERVDVSQLVAEVIALLNTLISKRATLEFDLPKNLPAVWGNPTRIRQVAMNLVLNASESLGEGTGVIRITTSCVPPGAVPQFIGSPSLPGSHYLRLEVADTGCGMTDEQKNKIFDPYFTTKRTGHGLGLAVVHGIVESHGGIINVTTAPSKGATFEVFLPLVQRGAAEGPLSASGGR